MRLRRLFLLLLRRRRCRQRPEVNGMIWREGRAVRAKHYANIRRSEKPRMGCRGVWGGERGNAGAPVYLGHVAVLSETCDVFQGVGGVTDRAVMWGCVRETLQIIREQRGVGGGGGTCLHCMQQEQCAEL